MAEPTARALRRAALRSSLAGVGVDVPYCNGVSVLSPEESECPGPEALGLTDYPLAVDPPADHPPPDAAQGSGGG